jgi:cytochrome c
MARLLKLGLAITISVAFGAASAFGAGDAGKGASLFVRCAVCHTAQSGGPNRMGPNLFGITSRKAGTLSTYSYSRSMARSGIAWDQQTLSHYLMGPSSLVPRTKMTFAGFPNQQQADDVAAYLATLN